MPVLMFMVIKLVPWPAVLLFLLPVMMIPMQQHYPGFYDRTMAVAATNHNDAKAWYSNYGDWVDIAAPGGETMISQEGVLSTLPNDSYGWYQGTSMACPHVSGLAALIIAEFGGPGFTNEMLWNRIIETSDNIDAADPTFAGLLGEWKNKRFYCIANGRYYSTCRYY
jgi:subtilisin family serine protease